jgi:hypothetical protein
VERRSRVSIRPVEPSTPEPATAPASVRLYQASSRARLRVRRLAQALFDGFFLGLMDREALTFVDRSFYGSTRELVDGDFHGYADEAHIRSGLRAWEHAAATAHFPAAGRVVVTAAGAGREVLGLRALGFDAVGYEPNEQLVAAGRDLLAREGAGDRLLACGRDVFPRAAVGAGAVVVGWGSYMLIPGRRRRVEFLRGAREALEPGGPLLLSFFVRPRSRYFSIVAAVAAPLRRLRRDDRVERGDALAPNFVPYFTRTEIEAELAAAGFDCLEYRTEPYGHAVARAI